MMEMGFEQTIYNLGMNSPYPAVHLFLAGQ